MKLQEDRFKIPRKSWNPIQTEAMTKLQEFMDTGYTVEQIILGAFEKGLPVETLFQFGEQIGLSKAEVSTILEEGKRQQ